MPTAHHTSARDRIREATHVTGYSPDVERPLGGYVVLMGTFTSITGGFTYWMHRSGRRLPDRVSGADLALTTVATHKLARLVAKDKVTATVRAPFTRYQGEGGPGEVEEAPRDGGLRKAIGELLVCPYCIGMWIAAAFTMGLIVAPRPTRWIATAFTTLFGADVLQIAYKKAEDAL